MGSHILAACAVRAVPGRVHSLAGLKRASGSSSSGARIRERARGCIVMVSVTVLDERVGLSHELSLYDVV